MTPAKKAAKRKRVHRVLALDPGRAIRIEDWPDFSLRRLQQAVGGYIQALKAPGSMTLLFNEEGLLHGLEYNAEIVGVPLVGNVVIVGRHGAQFCGLTDAQMERVSVASAASADHRAASQPERRHLIIR